MSGGVGFKLEIAGLDQTVARLNALGTIHFYELLDRLSAIGKTQTEKRIRLEKTTPDGKAWPKTTDGRGALYVTGAFAHNYIQAEVSGDSAVWGSGWKAARIHQFGGVIRPVNAKCLAFSIGATKVFAKASKIPARAYLGVSAENAKELEAAAVKFIGLRLAS